MTQWITYSIIFFLNLEYTRYNEKLNNVRYEVQDIL